MVPNLKKRFFTHSLLSAKIRKASHWRGMKHVVRRSLRHPELPISRKKTHLLHPTHRGLLYCHKIYKDMSPHLTIKCTLILGSKSS